MTLYDDFMVYKRILRILNDYFPSMLYFYSAENPYSKLFLYKTFVIVDRFSKFLQHSLGQTKHRIIQGNILTAVKLSIKYLQNTVIRNWKSHFRFEII